MARFPAPSIRVRWLLTVVIVVALLAVGFTYYNRLKTEQGDLLASIAQSNKTIESFRAIDLAPLKAEVADLENRAKTAASQEASLTQRYRGYSHSIEIEERLYSTAADEANGGIQFESYLVGVDAEADVPPALLNFLQKVSGYFGTGTIGSINLSVPRPPEEGTSEEKSTLTFQLHVTFIPQEAA
jgi:hypothetical protein